MIWSCYSYGAECWITRGRSFPKVADSRFQPTIRNIRNICEHLIINSFLSNIFGFDVIKDTGTRSPVNDANDE